MIEDSAVSQPSEPLGDGRDAQGRFAKGNPGGKGNPYAKKVAALRAALLDAVTPEHIATVVQALIEQASTGDVAAVRELLDRCVGKAEAIDLVERLSEVEELLRTIQEAMTGSPRNGQG